MADITITGTEPLIKYLQTAANVQVHKSIVKDCTSRLQKSAKRHAVFTKGYSTGATKRSISLELTAGGFEGHVKSGTDYSGYLEKGTRFMEAQPFMKPAFDEIEPQFIAELRRAAIVK